MPDYFDELPDPTESPPKKDKKGKIITPSQTETDMDEFLRGLSTINRQVAQGATMDFADEIGGAIAQQLGPSGRQGLERVQRAFSGEEVSPEEALQRQMAAASLGYRDVQQAGQAQSERDREERPYVSFASNVAGGLLTGRALGGATTGAANRAGQTVSNNLPAFTQPLRTAASAVRGSRLGRAATNVVGGSAVGAGYGAVAGVGASQGNLDTQEGRERMVEDAQSGATAGAVLGGGLSTLGEGLNAAVSHVRRNISGLQGIQDDIPEQMMEELMAPPSVGERGSFGETLQRTANPQTVERRLNTMGTQAREALFNAEDAAYVSPLVMDDVISLADDAIARLPSGIQPRLGRILRNLKLEAAKANKWAGNGMPVSNVNAILDELAELGRSGSRDAARVHQQLVSLTQRGIQSSLEEARNMQRLIPEVVNERDFGSPFITKVMGEVEQTIQNSMTVQQQSQLMANVDRALAQLKRNVERMGGRANPLGVEELIGRYAAYSLTNIPLHPRDLQRVLPAVASLLRIGMQAASPVATASIIGQATSNDEPLPRQARVITPIEQIRLLEESPSSLAAEEQIRLLEESSQTLTPEEQTEMLRQQLRSIRSQRRRNKRAQ